MDKFILHVVPKSLFIHHGYDGTKFNHKFMSTPRICKIVYMASLISSDIALLYYMTVTYIITYKKKGNPIEGN